MNCLDFVTGRLGVFTFTIETMENAFNNAKVCRSQPLPPIFL